MNGLIAVLTAMLCVVWVFGFFIGIDRVSGISMYPYLNDGDWIVYSRTGSKIRRNEVVVFEKNGESLVKRVVGLPGDRVEIDQTGGRVVVNGTLVREDYVTLTTSERDSEAARFGAPQTVMNGQYLVLGDNRAESIDSRDSRIGTLPAEQILGKVALIIRARR